MLGSAVGRIEYSIGKRKFSYTWRGFDFPECQGLKISGKHLGYSSRLKLTPLSEVPWPAIHRLEWEIPFTFAHNDRIFLNGYQSWTDSRERSASETVRQISPAGRILNCFLKFSPVGDYDFLKPSRRKGDFHGFTYGYIRPGGIDRIIFLGSLSEKEGFTVIKFSAADSSIILSWDCDGVILNRSRKVLKIFFDQGEEEDVFNTWFKSMDITPPETMPAVGWTSWYNYYSNINEDIILKNLEGFTDKNLSPDFIQIDDGYQDATGDWLSVDPVKFPRGLSPVVDRIHAEGFRAGLWLAPFAAEKNSLLVNEHPDWFLRDMKGKMVRGGMNWGGFYVPDVYNKEFRAWLKTVFRTVLDEWHFDMVKLDFLYAACLSPPEERTRGEVMYEAMKFLRELAGSRTIIGCGVPLGSAFGKVDYCRIGCDVSLDWNNRRLRAFMPREGVSTVNSIGNTLGRRHLDGRAFLNDPDVFLLRDVNIKMSEREKDTLFNVNSVLGSLLFTSDDPGSYDEKKAEMFRGLAVSRQFIGLKQEGNVYLIRFLEGRTEKLMIVNLSGGEFRYNGCTIQPRETKIL